ncbi:MAG: transglycosylase SLT domain-containing protein, partial [Thermodesulfobacteriota bacterium]
MFDWFIKLDYARNRKLMFNTSTLIFSFLFLIFFVSFKHPSHAEINCNYISNQQFSDNPKERYKKGYCQVKIGRYQEGFNTLNGLQNLLTPISDYIYYYQAVAQRGVGNKKGAEEIFKKVTNEYPKSGVKKKALIGLGEIYTETGNYVQAEKIFGSLLLDEEDRQSKSEYLFNLAESLEGQGKFKDAINNFKKVWVEFPDTNFANRSLRRAQSISKSHSLPFMTNKTDYLRRAEILFDNSRWSAALMNFNKVIKTNHIKSQMAIAMFNLGRLDEASNLLAQIDSPEALFWRGKISAKQGRDGEASQFYRRINLTYPSSQFASEGLYNAARLYQINDNMDKAIGLYDELLRKYPNSEYAEDGAWYLGWIYYKRGMLNEALAAFSAYTNSSSSYNSSSNKYWKARALEKQGRRQEALSLYEELARSTLPSYHSYLAQKKTGIKPYLGVSGDEINTQSSNVNNGKAKAELLIDLEMFDDAISEIDIIREESINEQDLMQVSLLYANADDFYNSIKIAQRLNLPQAIELSYPRGYKEIVRAYSKKYNVDEYLIYSIMREESRFQKNAVSPANAIGLMQLIPSTARSTARQVGISGFNVDMLNIPRINIELGIYYFKKVLDEFNGDVHLALASYNAGPHRAADWMVRFHNFEKDEFVEEIPFRETRNYIRRILRSYGAYKAIYGNEASQPRDF